MGLSQAELKAIATLDNSQFKAGVTEIKNSVNGFATGQLKELSGMIGGAFAVGAVVEFGKTLMHEAAANERFAKSIGMTAGMLNELGDMAAETGAEAGGFNQKIIKMVEAQEKAITGDSKMVEAFKALGISMADLTSKTPDQLLLAVAQGAQHDATAIHNLNEVMGRGAAGEYGMMLKNIAENGLPKVSTEAENAITRFAQLNKQMEIAKDKMGHMAMEGVAGIGTGGGMAGGAATGALAGVSAGKMFGPWGMAVGGLLGGAVGGYIGGKAGQANEAAADEAEANMAKDANQRNAQARQRLEELKIEHAAAVDKIKLEGTKKTDEVSRKREKAIDSITVGAPKAADSFAEYGRMIGGSYGSSGGNAERQLKELEIIAQFAEEQAKISAETKDKIEALGGE